jgi:hypothetical protein
MPRAVRFYCALGFEVLRQRTIVIHHFSRGDELPQLRRQPTGGAGPCGGRTSQFHLEAHGQWNFLIGLLLRPWPTLNEILGRVRLGPLGSAALLMLQGAGKAIHKDRRDATEDNGQMWVTT